jgi:hypothetical protein
MISPSGRLPILNRIPISPPMKRENVAMKPHKNAFIITVFLKGQKKENTNLLGFI